MGKKNEHKNNNRKDASLRDNYTGAIIGDKGQGKSTLMAKMAIAYYESSKRKGNPKRVLIYDPSEARAFKKFKAITVEELKLGVYNPTTGRRHAWTKGIRRVVDRGNIDYEVFFRTIIEKVSNSLVFIDEARDIYTGKGEMKRYQKELITKHRNYNIDLYLVFHQFMDINIRVRGLIWIYIIFKTIEEDLTPSYFRTRQFPNPTSIHKVWQKVSKIPYDPGLIMQHYGVFKKSL